MAKMKKGPLLALLFGVGAFLLYRRKTFQSPTGAPSSSWTGFAVEAEDTWLRSFNTLDQARNYVTMQGIVNAVIYPVNAGKVGAGFYA